MAAVEEWSLRLSQKIRTETRIKEIYSELEDLTFKADFGGYVQMSSFTRRPVYAVTDMSTIELLGEIHRNVRALEREPRGREIWKGITVDGGIYKLWGTPRSLGYNTDRIYHIPVGGIEVIADATVNYQALVNITVVQGEREQLSETQQKGCTLLKKSKEEQSTHTPDIDKGKGDFRLATVVLRSRRCYTTNRRSLNPCQSLLSSTSILDNISKQIIEDANLLESLEIMLAKLEQAKANNETLKVSYATILFTGSPGVGKTSLMKKLNKKKLNKQHHSTGVAKSKHAICIESTAVIESSKGLQWTDLDYSSMISHLNKHLHKKFPSSSLPVISLPKKYAPESGGTSKKIKLKVDVEKADPVAVDIAKADSSNTPSLGDVWNIINFLDTGGQPEFINVLPAVSSSIALTFIVFNLNKSLNGLVHVQHNVHGDPSFEPYYLDCTNLQFIKHLMVSSENFNTNITPLGLKSISRKDDGNDSKICYVGTHALAVSEEAIKEIDDHLSSIAKELNLHKRLFWSSPKDQLLRLFPIDLFPVEKEEKKEFEDIIEGMRDNIRKQVQKRDYYEVPITWFIFLLKLQNLCKEKKISYISYKEAVDIWRDEDTGGNKSGKESTRGLHEDHHKSVSQDNPTQDVCSILLFFHFMGMLFYYHTVEGICDFVFVDRQWMFDKLTELVEIKFTKGCNKKDVNAEDVEKFTKEGRLNIRIIENLKIDLQGIQPLYFIHLLDHLNIVAPIDLKAKEYFMPCALPSFLPKESQVSNFDKFYGTVQHEPLLVGFKDGPMPHGFFCHLIVELFRNVPTGWDPPLQTTSVMRHVYNNLITFPTTSGHYISLFYEIGYAKIQIRHEPSEPSIIHYNVMYELDEALQKVSDHLHFNKEKICYGFYCKCERIQHFAKLKDLTSPTEYVNCGYNNTKLTGDHKVWLQGLNGCHNKEQTVITNKEPNMKLMHQLVIPKVSYCWKTIADHLEYPIEKNKEIDERQRGDPFKCCAELMEDWLISDRGVAPKTWDKLVLVLKEIGDLSSAAHRIERSLIRKGLL